MKNSIFYITFLFAILLSACTKVGVNDLQVDCSTAYGIPICTYNAKVFDLIKGKSGQISVIGSDSIINIECYKGNLDTVLDIIPFNNCDTASGYYPFANVSDLSQYLGTTLPAGDYQVFSEDFDIDLNFDSKTGGQSYRVDTAHFTAPKLAFTNVLSGFTLNSSNYIEVIVKLKGCIDESGAEPQMNYQFFTTSSVEKSFKNFTAWFQEQSGNNITMSLTCKLHSDGTQTLSSNASLSLSCRFSSLGKVNAYGTFRDNKPIFSNRYAQKLDESVASLFEDGYLPFYDPVLTIDLGHNVGADLRFKINSLYIIDESGNKHKATNFDPNGYKLGKPARPSSISGEIYPVYSNFTFNRNQGLNELFKGEGIPDSIVLEYSVYLPSIGESSDRDYIRNGNGMYADFDVQMKMQLDTGSYITLVNDVDADFSDIDTLSTNVVAFDTLYVYFDIVNGIPFDLTTSFSFLNAVGGQIIDSVQSISVKACAVDEDGKSVAPIKATNVCVAYSGKDIKSIMGTKKLRFKTKLVGKNGKKITICANDTLQVKVYAYPKFKANANGIFK